MEKIYRQPLFKQAWRLFWPAVIVFCLVVFVGAWLQYDATPRDIILAISESPQLVRATLSKLLVLLIACFVGAVVIAIYYIAKISANGLTTRNTIGKKVSVSWDDIDGLKYKKLLYLVQVKTKTSRWSLWAPVSILANERVRELDTL